MVAIVNVAASVAAAAHSGCTLWGVASDVHALVRHVGKALADVVEFHRGHLGPLVDLFDLLPGELRQQVRQLNAVFESCLDILDWGNPAALELSKKSGSHYRRGVWAWAAARTW